MNNEQKRLEKKYGRHFPDIHQARAFDADPDNQPRLDCWAKHREMLKKGNWVEGPGGSLTCPECGKVIGQFRY